MVDEFIYQFQSFSQYRGKLAQKSPHELELLKKCDGVWDLQGVLHYLQGLIDKSGVVRELATDGEVPKPSPCSFIAVFALIATPPPLQDSNDETCITLLLMVHPSFSHVPCFEAPVLHLQSLTLPVPLCLSIYKSFAALK